MPQCPACGHGNTPDADFCANCGTYLGWATGLLPGDEDVDSAEQPRGTRAPVRESQAPTPESGSTAAEAEPDPPARAPKAEQRHGVRVSMETRALTVSPGDDVAATVLVHNAGTTVEEFRLRLSGPAAHFGTVEPVDVSVYPGAAQPVVVRFVAARGPLPPAGQASYAVEATSSVHVGVNDRATGTVTVEPFTELHADLEPTATRGRSSGTHRVLVANAGNTLVAVDITVEDRDSVLAFVPARVSERVPNGSSVDVPIQVTGPRRWFGRSRSHPFTAEVTGGERPIAVSGVRHQDAVFPWWVPVVAVVVVALVAGGLFLAFRSGGTVDVPPTAGLRAGVAARELAEAGLVVDLREVVAQDAAEGIAVGTVPEAGSAVEPGSTVLLMVSVGDRDGGAATVPEVEGLPEDRAQALLETAGLEVQVRRVESATAEGTALGTDPTAGTELEPGSAVTLVVSQGPADPDSVEVPDVLGLSVFEAREALAAEGLTSRILFQPSTDVPIGDVVGTEPSVGSVVGRDAVVTVFVSRGPEFDFPIPRPPRPGELRAPGG